MRNRFALAAVAMLVSIAFLVGFGFLLGGPAYFRSVLLGAVWHILSISIVAAIIRFTVRSGGLALSAACGFLIAIAGFLILMACAASRI